jgi:CTP:molybdopterin cytidylyltransferase MocA
MFASLQIGLSELLEDPAWQVVAVLPVDHPLVRPATVERLAAATRVAAAPVFEGKHGHPVCLSRGLADQIAAGRVGGMTLREVLRRQGRDRIEVDDPGVVTNCNTPEALAGALSKLGLDS